MPDNCTRQATAPPLSGTRPNPARVYDYMLGGTDNFAADRAVVGRIRAALPELVCAAWANRGFHQRAAAWIGRQGVAQFIDVGCGLASTSTTTHHAVAAVNPCARVAYIDHDASVISHAQSLLTVAGATTVLLADLRDPENLLAGLHLGGLIDLARPAGLLATAVLDHVADDDDPWGCMARLVSALAPGSYLAISHLTADQIPPVSMAAAIQAYQDAAEQIHPRTRAEISRFFGGLNLTPPYEGAAPDLCRVGLWGAEDPVAAADDSSQMYWAGVAATP
jgi:trans-aconitate methyltransferase